MCVFHNKAAYGIICTNYCYLATFLLLYQTSMEKIKTHVSSLYILQKENNIS